MARRSTFWGVKRYKRYAPDFTPKQRRRNIHKQHGMGTSFKRGGKGRATPKTVRGQGRRYF